MGYLSKVAIHIIGEKSKFFDIQENFFQEIILHDRQDNDFYILETTSCLSKEEYRFFGRSLWFMIRWEGVDKKMVQGKLHLLEEKWGYYNDQWVELSKILNEINFHGNF